MEGPPEDLTEMLPACAWTAGKADPGTGRWYGLDDLRQELFIAAMKAARSYDPAGGRSWKSYLFVGLANRLSGLKRARRKADDGMRAPTSGHRTAVALNGYRGRRGTVDRGGREIAVADDDPPAVETADHLAGVIAALECPRARLAARLICYEDMSKAEVARALGMTRQGVVGMLRKAAGRIEHGGRR